MELSEIATLTGKGGLFKVLKPTRTGVILESLDNEKKKLVTGSHHRISILEEISIYTTTQEGSVPLKEILVKISDEFGEDPGLENNADAEEYKAFIKHILPDYDEDRVYASDIKKLVGWYKILLKYAPEVLQPESKDESEKTESKSKEN